MIAISGKGLTKRFGRRSVLQNISVSASSGSVLGIVGPNGSGKSTLARILSGLLRADAGTVELMVDDAQIPHETIPFHTGLVAPYLNVYDEFSPSELLALQRQLHGEPADHQAIAQTLADVGLADRAKDAVRTFSSGLRQRAVLALAVHRKPALLVLDEPTITLDEAGQAIVAAQIAAQRERGGITILATNDATERSWCTTLVHVQG